MDSSPQASSNRQRQPDQQELNQILSELEHLRFQVGKATALAHRLATVAPLKLLVTLLKDRKPLMSYAAIEALRVSDHEITPALIDLLLWKIDDPRDFIAAAAISVLGEKKVDSAKDELLECTEMENSRISGAAMNAVIHIDPTLTQELVDDFVESDEPGDVAAACVAIRQQKLADYVPKLLEAAEDFVARLTPDIPPDRKWSPERKYVGEIISTLAEFNCSEAIPLLKNLGANYVGLRTVAMNALRTMQVDIGELVEDAMTKRPSRGLRGLQKTIADNDETLYPQGFGTLAPYREANIRILANAIDDVAPGARVTGHAVLIRNRIAVLELNNGLHASLPVGELHWTRIKNLKPYTDWLTQQNEYVVTESNAETGFMAVSHRQLFASPWDDPTLLQQVHEGVVESDLKFGALISIGRACVGLLHASQLELQPAETIESRLPVGTKVRVSVIKADGEENTISLALASND